MTTGRRPRSGSPAASLAAALVLAALAAPGVLGAQGYPLVGETIASRDALYRQQQDDVEAWYTGDSGIPLTIFRYRPLPSEDIFAVAAAFNLPYDAVATLNGWDSPVLMPHDRELLVPNLPGIFVPAEPTDAWGRLLASADRGEGTPVTVALPDGSPRRYVHYRGSAFVPEERSRFLGSLFANPVPGHPVTSGFGYRPHPFTGERSFHPGVDLRADEGTPVLAARAGAVSEIGTLETYGLFVILDHGNGYQTVYGHLSEAKVFVGQEIEAGDVIALSGNTGISTGPHLHFEVRKDGRPVDPARLVNLGE